MGFIVTVCDYHWRVLMKIYLAGPMRGYKDWNFVAFDEAEQKWRAAGHQPFSPAQLFRSMDYSHDSGEDRDHVLHAIQVDLACLYAAEAIALLPGWEHSRGATVELALALYLNLPVYDALTMQPLTPPRLPWAFCNEIDSIVERAVAHRLAGNGAGAPT